MQFKSTSIFHKIIISSMMAFSLSTVNAQQWVQFSQQNSFKLFLNPALAGSNSEIYTSLVHRSQYTFLSKRVIASQFGEYSMPIHNKNIGIGLKFVNDFIGYQRYTNIEINGAYRLVLKKSEFAIGIGLGLVNLSINGSRLRTSGGVYENEAVIHNDEKIPNSNSGGLAPTFSFGLTYQRENFQLGAALHNLNSPQIKLLKSKTETKIFIDRTISVHAFYVIDLKKVKIKPMLNYSTDFVKHQGVLGVLTEVNNIFFGLAFRGYSGLNNDAIIIELGLKLKNRLKIGYAYDYNVSFLNKSNFGSHEISLNYSLPTNFKKKSKGNMIFNPRFL